MTLAEEVRPSDFERVHYLPSFTGSAGSEMLLLLLVRALQMQGDSWTRPVYFDFLEATLRADFACGTSRYYPLQMQIIFAGSKPAMAHLEELGMVTRDKWHCRLTSNCVWWLRSWRIQQWNPKEKV